MAAMSAGPKHRAFKVTKGGTTSTRKYRFQSFNQRISKLSIDPIRRSRPVEFEATDSSESHSFFKAALERWKDLNLSENFGGFVKDVRPICDSLPQIIHHHEDIFGMILRHVEKRDALSLEPLLDLLSSFAHDLGARFEVHFGAAVALVASLAATHPAVEVIEWSFACLTWLFKYLSRLLVPNLIPLFNIMAPLLGRESQKSHTTQFAAEALSYLIRRAAVSYNKDTKPLRNVVKYIVQDLGSFEVERGNLELYRHGLMALFVDSIKGVDRRLHSRGVQIYQTLLEDVLESCGGQQRVNAELIYGTTIGLLHFTDAQGFQPILEAITKQVMKLNMLSGDARIAICGRLIFIVSTVRRGSRIANWASLLNTLNHLLGVCDNATPGTVTQVYRAAAVILQSSSLDIMSAQLHAAVGVLAHERHAQHFLAFCNDLHDLCPEQFDSLILPYFTQWVIVSHPS